MTEFPEDVRLTSFQIQAERMVCLLLAKAGAPIATHTVGTMEVPFFNPGEPLPMVRLQGADFDIWLHDNEMGFRVRGTEFIAEAQDYRTDSALLERALSELKKALS